MRSRVRSENARNMRLTRLPARAGVLAVSSLVAAASTVALRLSTVPLSLAPGAGVLYSPWHMWHAQVNRAFCR